MNVNLITGATGFLGNNLVEKLIKKNEEVWIISRSLRDKKAEDRIKEKFPENFKKIKVLEGDILFKDLKLSKENIGRLKNKNIVFWHLAANLSFSTKDREKVWETNFNGTKNTVKLASKLSAKKFIHVSTAYVSGDYEGEILEDKLIEGQKFRNYYEHSKYEGEKYVRKNFKNIFLIFRPSIIIGEMYSGKAEGCTFGYYRFSYMFFLFKLWIVKKITGKSVFWKSVLKIMGTKYDSETDEIYTPWIYFLYAKGGVADLVAINFVVDSMVKIGLYNQVENETVHLTNNNPADAQFLMSLIFESLGYRKVKHKKVSKFILLFVVKFLYIIMWPIRDYTKSAYWYLPYFIRKYNFSHKNSQKYNLEGNSELDKIFMGKVNKYAKEEIFDKIDNPRI